MSILSEHGADVIVETALEHFDERCLGIVGNAVRVVLELLDEWGSGQG